MMLAREATETDTRQPDLYERTSWLSTEMLRLGERFTKIATKLETARVEQSFPAIRSACLDFETFQDQFGQLLGSLQKAIENETQRRAKSC